MASELETWWSQQYEIYSIRNVHTLPIFKKFVSLHYAYDRSNDEHSESFKAEGDKDTFQWADKVKGEGEVFSHDRSIDTWHYEHHFTEGVTLITVRAWKAPDKEWGEIIRKYREYSVEEKWQLKGETRQYERYELQDGEKRGIKTAAIPAVEGIERWTERFWEKSGESEFEKVWERPDATGGEIKNNKGEKWWGEVWRKTDTETEKKAWHTEGDHEWGHTMTEACGKKVNEKWDITKVKRNEERLIEDGDRRRGFRYVRDGADWYRQEWDGLSVVGLDEGIELLNRQKFLEELDEISVNGHDSLLKGETTIEMLLTEAPHFEKEVKDIKKERMDIPKPDVNSVDSLLVAIRTERNLLDKQERLKQRMIGDIHADHGMYYQLYILFDKLVHDSHATLKEISLALDRNKDAAVDEKKWGEIVNEIVKRPGFPSYDKSVLLIDNLIELEAVKQKHIEKLKGGIERAEVEKAMELLYQIMVKHDAVSDKIVEMVGDQELKAKLDSFQDQFEQIHATYQENADPDKLHENLRLLLDYQPIHLHLMGRLRGYAKNEVNNELDGIKSAVEETKGHMSLKNARNKVRSGRPARDNPFQVLDRALTRLIPFMLQIDRTVHGRLQVGSPALMTSLKSYLEKTMDTGDPFEVTVEKATILQDVAQLLEPFAILHEENLEDLDRNMDDVIRHQVSQVYDDQPGAISQQRGLLGRHYSDEDSKLLSEKLASMGLLSDEVMELQEKIENLYLTIGELERIIEEKSEEISELTVVLDQRDLRVHQLNTELYDIQKYKPWFEAKDKECEALKLRIAELISRVMNLEGRNKVLTEDNVRLIALVEELEKFKLNALNLLEENKKLQGIITQYEVTAAERKIEYENTIKRLNDEVDKKQTIIDDKESECAKHLAELARVRSELMELTRAHQELLRENDTLRDRCNDLEAFKISALDYKSENERLKAIIKSFEDMLGKRTSQYDEIIANLNAKIATLDIANKSKDTSIEDLRAQLKSVMRERQRQLQLRTMMKLTNTLKTERTSVFLTWKLRADLPPEVLHESIMMETPDVTTTAEKDEEEWNQTQLLTYSQAEAAIIKIRKNYLMNNTVFKHLLNDDVKFDQPMPIVSFYVLIEEIMEKKVESDKSDLSEGRRPAHFADYALEYLLKTHGVKKVVQRDFARMIPMLYQQYNANVPLGVLIARLMHMFHPHPAPLEASVLVMRYSLAFKPLAEHYTESRQERNLPPLSEAERMITGGESILFHVLDAFYDQFADESVYAWHFLRYLRPTNLSIGDYVCSVIQWFAKTRQGMDEEKVWEIVSGEMTTISWEALVYGVNTRLGLKLSQRIIKEAHADLTHSGILTRSALETRARHLQARPMEDFLVSRGLFLTAVLEAYCARWRRNALRLKAQFEEVRSESITQSAFAELVKVHEARIPEETIEKLHDGGVKWSSSTPVDVIGYPAELLVHPVGGLSKAPLQVEKFGALTDDHAFEYDLMTGSKILFTKISITTTTRRSTRSGSARRLRLNP